MDTALVDRDLLGGTGRGLDLGAVALKISDGASRARVPVLIAALRRLGLEVPAMPEPVLGGGRPVGEVRAVFA